MPQCSQHQDAQSVTVNDWHIGAGGGSSGLKALNIEANDQQPGVAMCSWNASASLRWRLRDGRTTRSGVRGSHQDDDVGDLLTAGCQSVHRRQFTRLVLADQRARVATAVARWALDIFGWILQTALGDPSFKVAHELADFRRCWLSRRTDWLPDGRGRRWLSPRRWRGQRQDQRQDKAQPDHAELHQLG